MGDQLVNGTVSPFWSVAEMLTCTLNEIPLHIGASVPTTNDDPVTGCELLLVEEVKLLPQPAARRVAVVKATRDGRGGLPDFEMSIPDSPRFLRTSVAARTFSP